MRSVVYNDPTYCSTSLPDLQMYHSQYSIVYELLLNSKDDELEVADHPCTGCDCFKVWVRSKGQERSRCCTFSSIVWSLRGDSYLGTF